ncbi:helix-turn-helix transcriptional regulator [Geobacter sp. AOG1]|uniref:helix-turn-helix transcriptional regulator n=1 Tax=Geobacter sp. AOG1 TaxID=1566346 RepID=UPI001CC53C6B|nr:helix-turn-helix transcriptional regulator [Geobacter sp. AOG1]
MNENTDKPEKSLAQAVAVDGSSVRSIREMKKLTQLYVANVVGVTTDTISRWENNRYPTIKRDNAEKLAAALEVTLEEILRREEEPPPEEEPSLPPPTHRRHWLLLLLLATVVLVAALLLTRPIATAPAAVRWLPTFGAPGEIIPVQIKVLRREAGTGGIIVRSQLPAGWQLVNATPQPSAGQPSSGEVKWLLPGGSDTVTISCTVKISPDTPLDSAASFSGKVVLQSGDSTRTEAIGGPSKVTINGRHWADANGDGRIDDNEIMPAYYLTEEMKGLGLDWKTIEAIWSGKGYTWDRARQEFVVIR